SAGIDLNLDGRADFLVGAPGNNSGGAGRVYVFYGGPALDGDCDGVIEGESAGDRFGWNVTAAGGDLNGDGSGDFVVGAFGKSVGGQEEIGRAYVYSAFATVPVELEALSAAASGAGVLLSWSLSEHALTVLSGVRVQR